MRFSDQAMNQTHPQWSTAIRRPRFLYEREDDIRSPFERDYTRLLHSTAYRRLKHKTQVFFASANDHVCTRMEHVQLVASVSHSLSKRLGLNTELARAIALGHDLGHAPFGHHGERVLAQVAREALGRPFWHEGNSLRFADGLETLPDPDGQERNLDLTYAVRDGIITHCGEVTEERLYPRVEPIDLWEIEAASELAPFTWEGCIVKVADTISYLGRDIEDAYRLGLLGRTELRQLIRIVRRCGLNWSRLNNGLLMHELMLDLVNGSSPENGICICPPYHELVRALKEFSRTHIYDHDRLRAYQDYATLVIRTIYEKLAPWDSREDSMDKLRHRLRPYPLLGRHFTKWLLTYSDRRPGHGRFKRFDNRVVYHLDREGDYRQAIVDFISGMTDHFAIRVFNELTSLQMETSPLPPET